MNTIEWLEAVVASDKPGAMILEASRSGELADLLPDLAILDGVPQPKQYHPEIDTLIHVAMTMDKVVNLGADRPTRYGMLFHDLGKGITPKEILPHHYGHEKAGVPIVEAICNKFDLDPTITKTALTICEWHGHLHVLPSMKPSKIIRLFYNIGAFDPDQKNANLIVKQYHQACLADHLGRPIFENMPYPQGELFLKIYDEIISAIRQHEIYEFDILNDDKNQNIMVQMINGIKNIKSDFDNQNIEISPMN